MAGNGGPGEVLPGLSSVRPSMTFAMIVAIIGASAAEQPVTPPPITATSQVPCTGPAVRS